jgi:menaquinone-9 beta-reductase
MNQASRPSKETTGMKDKPNFDVIIIGGGIAGSTLAANLGRTGLVVLLLERETKFIDRVRGEWMAPWGVAETKKLGIYDRLMAAGGHHIAKAINYDELLTPDQALANSMSLHTIHPEAPGPLCMEHVSIQEVAMQFAIDSGAVVVRGVKNIVVNAGAKPTVEYSDGGIVFTKTCRLIVGADGRSSTVRRQLGLQLDEHEIDHLISGLLIDGADEWPSDVQSVGKIGEVMYLVFPQGGGKIRLYVDYALTDRGKYSGEQGASNLLKAFDTALLPNGRSIANAKPIGPCQAFPSQDASLNDPYVEGAILIDARIVRDLLLTNKDWSVSCFAAYGLERNERMRRIMRMTHFATTLFVRFDPHSIEARARAMQRMATNPELGALFACAFTAPEVIPAECFTDDFYDRIFAP